MSGRNACRLPERSCASRPLAPRAAHEFASSVRQYVMVLSQAERQVLFLTLPGGLRRKYRGRTTAKSEHLNCSSVTQHVIRRRRCPRVP
jgi:hypothetical protein